MKSVLLLLLLLLLPIRMQQSRRILNFQQPS
jgi:hypothetical protein